MRGDDDAERWIEVGLDIMIYIGLISCFIIIDACEFVSNFTRMIGPALLIGVSIQNFYMCQEEGYRWDNHTLFTHRSVQITLKDVERYIYIKSIYKSNNH